MNQNTNPEVTWIHSKRTDAFIQDAETSRVIYLVSMVNGLTSGSGKPLYSENAVLEKIHDKICSIPKIQPQIWITPDLAAFNYVAEKYEGAIQKLIDKTLKEVKERKESINNGSISKSASGSTREEKEEFFKAELSLFKELTALIIQDNIVESIEKKWRDQNQKHLERGHQQWKIERFGTLDLGDSEFSKALLTILQCSGGLNLDKDIVKDFNGRLMRAIRKKVRVSPESELTLKQVLSIAFLMFEAASCREIIPNKDVLIYAGTMGGYMDAATRIFSNQPLRHGEIRQRSIETRNKTMTPEPSLEQQDGIYYGKSILDKSSSPEINSEHSDGLSDSSDELNVNGMNSPISPIECCNESEELPYDKLKDKLHKETKLREELKAKLDTETKLRQQAEQIAGFQSEKLQIIIQIHKWIKNSAEPRDPQLVDMLEQWFENQPGSKANAPPCCLLINGLGMFNDSHTSDSKQQAAERTAPPCRH